MRKNPSGAVLLALSVVFLGVHANAQEAVPGDVCSGAGAYVKSGGPELSGVNHFLVCQSGTWKAILSANAAGEITKLGNQTCATGDVLRWDGTKFICSAGTCGDTTPNAFAFTDQSNVALSTLTTSNVVQVNGLACVVNTSITGGGSPEYRICSDPGCSTVVQDWTSSASALSTGQYVQVRLTSSASGGAALNATLFVGNGADVWTVATAGSCASSPPVGTVCADGTVYAGITPDGTVPMYVTRCDAGMTWNGTACTGSRFELTWNNGTTNYTTTGITNTATGEANTNALAALSDAGADYAAAEHCFGFDDGNGNTDWYLPSRQELSLLYDGQSTIGEFGPAGKFYWSSTDATVNTGYALRIDTGASVNLVKSISAFLRCARK